MKGFDLNRLVFSTGVMLAAFVAGTGSYWLWAPDAGSRAAGPAEIAITPVSLKMPPPRRAASVCDWLDLYAEDATGWPRYGPRKTVDLGVLDSKACRIFHDAHGTGLIDVDLPKVSWGKGVVSVKIDENGFVRNATVLVRSEKFADKFLINEALNVRIRPVRLGGDPTRGRGVLTEKYFEAADLVEKSGKTMIRGTDK